MGRNIFTQTDADKLPEQMQCEIITLREGAETVILLV